MGIGSVGYKVVLVLHIVAVVVGLGSVSLNGLYGAQARKRKGVGGHAIGEANFAVTAAAQPIIYTIPLFGIGLVMMSDGVWKFSHTWIWASILLYLTALGISHGVMTPAARRMNALAGELASGAPPAGATAGGPPPQVLEMESLGKRLGMFGGILHVLLVVIIILMVFKPGV